MGQKGFASIIVIFLIIIGVVLLYFIGGFEKLPIKTPPQLVPSTTTPVSSNNANTATTQIQNNENDSGPYPLVGGTCDIEGCLFYDKNNGALIGFASIKGYYLEYDGYDWGTQLTCKGFIVTGGNEVLIKHFNDWIEQGNTLNKIINNNLVVNIDTEELGNETKTLITGSSKNNEVILNIIREIPSGTGGHSTCTSVIQIISARGVPK